MTANRLKPYWDAMAKQQTAGTKLSADQKREVFSRHVREILEKWLEQNGGAPMSDFAKFSQTNQQTIDRWLKVGVDKDFNKAVSRFFLPHRIVVASMWEPSIRYRKDNPLLEQAKSAVDKLLDEEPSDDELRALLAVATGLRGSRRGA